MIYAHTNMDFQPKTNFDECNIPKPERADREPGIYEQVKETRMVLSEILDMLALFKREVIAYTIPDDEKAMEPTCFKDDVDCVNTLAFAIKGDLARLLAEFR